MLELVWTFFIGVLASIVSGMAGGGGGLISAPFLILIGLPPQAAVATTKFGALGLTLGSLAKLRTTKHIRKEHVVYLSLLSIAAAFIGSQILLISSNEVIQKIVGGAMIVTIPFLFMKDIGLVSTKKSLFLEVIGYVLYFIILVLQAGFGAGVGMTLMVIMMGCLGFTALESNATRRIPGFLLAAISLLIYMLNDVVQYGYGLAMLAGMVVGGYIGTHIAIKQGNRFIKIVFAVVVGILGIQLIVS